jgi:hypothetical protein
MSPQDYWDWSEVSGIYIKNVSHLERYQTYQKGLSPAGVNVVVTFDFLRDNRADIDLNHWRSFSVYEPGADSQKRIELTATALRAIGAQRVAAKLLTVNHSSPMDSVERMMEQLLTGEPLDQIKGTSGMNLSDLMKGMQASLSQLMPGLIDEAGNASATPNVDTDIETHEIVEALLTEYVREHQDELLADVAKHGDPRSEPKYSRQNRMNELDRMRQRYYEVEEQKETATKICQYLTQIEKKIAAGVPASKLTSLRTKLSNQLKQCRRTPEVDRIGELGQALDQATRFQQLHAVHFPDQATALPEELRTRLERLGPCEIQPSAGRYRWDLAVPLRCDWTSFSLSLSHPKKKPQCLRPLLEAVDHLVGRWDTMIGHWREQVLESFRNVEVQLDEWDLEDYRLDAEGQATDASVLAQAGNGQLAICTEDGELFSASLYFPVQWDPEHGFVLEFDLDVPQSQTEELTSLLGKVKFTTPPALENQIEEFQQVHQLTLPPTLAQFLRLHNGGVPEPNHFTRKIHGQIDPFQIQAFYGLGTNDTSVSLEAAAKRMNDLSLADTLLPIARVADLQGIGLAEFVLVLKGTRAGRVLLCDAETLDFAAEDPSHVSELMSYSFAKNMSTLFTRIESKPKEDLPSWLQCIRNGDLAGLVGWLQNDGKFSEKFKEYGHHFQQSVGEYLIREAPAIMIEGLLEQNHINPKQLKPPQWMTYSASTPARLRELMEVLPQPIWDELLASPFVWQDREIREALAARKFDFNTSVNQEGMPPLHLAVQLGDQEATRWLLAHGADPHKRDRYGRDAFVWAESAPGYDCLPILEGKESVATEREDAVVDVAGLDVLIKAADALSPGVHILIQVQMKSPPVTRAEKAYYSECHYLLEIAIGSDKVTFKDMSSPRLDFLYVRRGWPDVLFAPILQWPDLTFLWETLVVREYELAKAARKRDYKAVERADLVAAASEMMRQASDAHEAAIRAIRLAKR